MAFNHYAKLKRIILDQPEGWYIVRINEPTTSTSFKGEKLSYDHYYRLYAADGSPIKYGKFQKLEKLASVLGLDEIELPFIHDEAL